LPREITQQFDNKVFAKGVKPMASCAKDRNTFHACNLPKPTNI